MIRRFGNPCHEVIRGQSLVAAEGLAAFHPSFPGAPGWPYFLPQIFCL